MTIALELKQLKKTYPGGVQALRGIDLQKYLKQLDLWEKRNERARMLSGGMKRRLMIARALMHEPKLLILDEPTAGVDIELRRSMWGFLKDLNDKGTTIILWKRPRCCVAILALFRTVSWWKTPR